MVIDQQCNLTTSNKTIPPTLVSCNKINFWTQDGAAPAQGTSQANPSRDDLLVSANTLLNQKHRISGQPVLKFQASSGLCAYCLVPYSFSVFFFIVTYILSYKSSLSSIPLCSSLHPWECMLPAS